MSAKAVKAKKPRTQKRARKTRKKLKEAALNVFSEKSVGATTIEEITEKADVGKGTLYQHFSDKDEIVVTLVDEAVTHLIESIQSYDDRPNTLEDMLKHLIGQGLLQEVGDRLCPTQQGMFVADGLAKQLT